VQIDSLTSVYPKTTVVLEIEGGLLRKRLLLKGFATAAPRSKREEVASSRRSSVAFLMSRERKVIAHKSGIGIPRVVAV